MSKRKIEFEKKYELTLSELETIEHHLRNANKSVADIKVLDKVVRLIRVFKGTTRGSTDFCMRFSTKKGK